MVNARARRIDDTAAPVRRTGMVMTTALVTRRLLLRPLERSDAPAIARLIGEWEVIRWLTSPPWPYALQDAVDFVTGPASAGSRAIEIDGQFAGVIGIDEGDDGPDRELGYWLGIPFWGHRIMSEAARAVVGHHFATGGGDLVSGYLSGNAKSCAILTGLGFRDAECIQRFANPHGCEMPLQRMALRAVDWMDGHAG